MPGNITEPAPTIANWPTVMPGNKVAFAPIDALKMQFRREDQGEWLLVDLPDDFQPTEPPPGQSSLARSSEAQGSAREQARDYVAGKYQRKLEQLANDPAKAEKLLRAMNGEVEARVKKLERRQP